ncbi:trypsin-like serine protease [Vibrio fluvialis]|uniref:trypsin-like serine protease n=1 Tax=Vibrio fluvialis TaxID=676 RepID=UPI00192B80DF|nr:trypsin-like serine protease [Vibrio fluvialis]MBL4262806.1 trypsin-like serine protease [Vibrio fluvialis]
MKNNKVIATAVFLALSGVSTSVLAVSGGVSVNRNDYQQYVDMNCTGTLISGKWVLTAAHCARNNGLIPVRIYDGSEIDTVAQYEHADYEYSGVDLGLWELKSAAKVNKTGLVSLDEVVSGDLITMYGFGGTAPDLAYSVQSARAVDSSYPSVIETDSIGQGTSKPGDSGSAYLDDNGYVRGVHNGTDDGVSMAGTRITYAQDLLLQNIDGWNYPTALSFTGETTVNVQSLHQAGTVDQAFTEGDVTLDLDNSTCVTTSSLSSFDVCTYVITSSGGEGKLYLSSSEYITVNAVDDTSGGDNSSGGGGGSIGFWSLIFGGAFGLWRRKQELV